MKLKITKKSGISKRVIKLMMKAPVNKKSEQVTIPDTEDEPNTDTEPEVEMLNVNAIMITPHAQKRASHRGITRDMIESTLLYGKKICKQGLCFYIMPAKLMSGLFTQKFAEKIANTVVVVKRPGIIITVYKNKYALRNIKRKPKRLRSGYPLNRCIKLKKHFDL